MGVRRDLRGSAVDRTDWKAYILPLLFGEAIKRNPKLLPKRLDTALCSCGAARRTKPGMSRKVGSLNAKRLNLS